MSTEADTQEGRRSVWLERFKKAGSSVRNLADQIPKFSKKLDVLGRIIALVASIGVLVAIVNAASVFGRWAYYHDCDNELALKVDFGNSGSGAQMACYASNVGSFFWDIALNIWHYLGAFLSNIMVLVVIVGALVGLRWVIGGFKRKAV